MALFVVHEFKGALHIKLNNLKTWIKILAIYIVKFKMFIFSNVASWQSTNNMWDIFQIHSGGKQFVYPEYLKNGLYTFIIITSKPMICI